MKNMISPRISGVYLCLKGLQAGYDKMVRMAASIKLRLLITKTIVVLLILALTIIISAGCKKTTTTSKSTSTTKTGEGKTVNKNLSAQGLKVLEGDVPGSDIVDLPRYKGSIRQSETIVVGANGKQSGALIYQTSSKADDVVSHFIKQGEKEDWKLVVTIETKEGKILQFSKGTRKASVNIARREGIDFTDITIIYREF